MSLAEPVDSDVLHQLVVLFLTVAFDTDEQFDPTERYAIHQVIERWSPGTAKADANGLIDTALKGVRSGMTEAPEALARTLGPSLSGDQRLHLLTDLGHIARADGHLSVSEAHVIRRIRTALAS